MGRPVKLRCLDWVSERTHNRNKDEPEVDRPPQLSLDLSSSSKQDDVVLEASVNAGREESGNG